MTSPNKYEESEAVLKARKRDQTHKERRIHTLNIPRQKYSLLLL